jgi:hypothetical protein
MLNQDTCNDYEIWLLQTNVPPYTVGSAAIYNLHNYWLRTATKITQDSAGLDGGDAAGVPVTPMALRHADAFSGQGWQYMTRFTVDNGILSFCWVWPATHSGSARGSSGICEGQMFRIRQDFDTQTCHQGDNKDLPYPPYFMAALKSWQTYGMMVADGGATGLISADADQGWGDPSKPTSDTWRFNSWTHCVPLSTALEAVDPEAEIVSVLSGQVYLNPLPRQNMKLLKRGKSHGRLSNQF